MSRFGIAPLTSMYWYLRDQEAETAIDWRPEVHDSDGLAMWTGNGERLWRPLNNPPRIMVSAFSRQQSARLRPHAARPRVRPLSRRRLLRPAPEPLGRAAARPGRQGWGKGSIQLFEIPTDDEIHDNVVAMWVPAEPVPAGAELHLNYRLYWLADEPFPTDLASLVATRLGRGGQPGQPRPKGVRKFMVEFLGGPLANLPFGVKPELVRLGLARNLRPLSADRGGARRRRRPLARAVRPHRRGDRPGRDARLPKSGGETLTETWMFQYHPF